MYRRFLRISKRIMQIPRGFPHYAQFLRSLSLVALIYSVPSVSHSSSSVFQYISYFFSLSQSQSYFLFQPSLSKVFSFQFHSLFLWIFIFQSHSFSSILYFSHLIMLLPSTSMFSLYFFLGLFLWFPHYAQFVSHVILLLLYLLCSVS
jgi:hypothetical protein